MGTIFNSKVFKGVSIAGKIVKGMAKNGVVFFGFHSHTIRILNRANEIGAIPDTDLVKFDAYVRSMVDFWMNYCDVFYRFRGTGDVNFKRINLANPEAVLADFFGGYTLDVSGIKGNGVNAYVDTNFNPSLLVSGQKYQPIDAFIGGVLSEANIGGTNAFTTANDTNFNQIGALNTNAWRINTFGTVSLNLNADTSGIGFKGIQRISTVDVEIFSTDILMPRQQSGSVITNRNQVIFKSGTNAFYNGKLSSFMMSKSISFEVSQEIRNHENADMTNLGITPIA